MISPNFDVLVVGGGCAGMTAAIGLVKSGFAVAVLEAASFPGAENWSGCVYFCENLAHPDILGPDGVEGLAWERRLVERGFFATDGHGLLGMTYRDPPAFRHCYTVLRPIFDHHLAQVAARLGVAILNETTVESLIRDGGKVIGVATNRGPLYADLVFLAEGDASHLVTREGYERFADRRETPKFLQGIKQVIDLPPGAIEEIFKVGPDESVAYEMLLRNGSLRGKDVHLNMGGFVYSNRQSLSVGLVLPADNLHHHFGGDPNLLVEWFEQLPALRPWLERGKRGVFGAKIIRGGGARDIPRLVDDGLAIGGAATAIGIDFPYPNFTGPATRMGLLLAQAARRIREEKSGFTQDSLERHYLRPLQATHHWRDVEFLRRWPSYVKRTTVFFDRQLDVTLRSAYVWTRPRRWLLSRWLSWTGLLRDCAGPQQLRELRADARHLARALRLREVVGQPGVWRLLLDGTVNALRDLFGSPRRDLPPAGAVRFHFTVAGGAEPSGPLPGLTRLWARRFLPVLGSAARNVYANDEQPLQTKLYSAVQVLIRQVNILDVLGAGIIAVLTALATALRVGVAQLWRTVTRRPPAAPRRGLVARYADAARQTTDLTPLVPAAGPQWENRLGQLAYETTRESHIHVLWPRSLPDRNGIAAAGLWHVCPAHVYEARTGAGGQVQVVVNFENCIKCETCWRTSDLVDWGRDGQHRFIYPVASPAADRLLATLDQGGALRAAPPRHADPWDNSLRELAAVLRADRPVSGNGHHTAELAELRTLLAGLDHKLAEFDEALAEEPRTIDKPRAGHLETLARYAHQLAVRFQEALAAGSLADSPRAGMARLHQQLLALSGATVALAERRARRTWDQRYSWAAADGRQIRQHHLTGLRRLLGLIDNEAPAEVPRASRWLRTEQDAAEVALHLVDWRTKLDRVFPRMAWRDLDRGTPLTSAQDALLRDLIAQVPTVDAQHLAATLHPPLRKALLAELGRRDPALAYRVANHLWARDLAQLAGAGATFLAQAARRWARGDEWACFTAIHAVPSSATGWEAQATFVPALAARSILVLLGDQLTIVPATPAPPELTIEPVATLGLRGAGLAGIRLAHYKLPEHRAPVDHARIHRAWSVLSAADLTAIGSGMAEVLCERALAHAASRVQFPGLFHDEDARDAIGKFGAIKKYLASMAARRLMIETLDHVLSPVDFSGPSAEQAGLVKALAAEALCAALHSLSYDAGQVFGGTGFSEDDVLAKLYRDAAAWRFLGPGNVAVFHAHGEALLHGWRTDGLKLAAFTGEAELFDQAAQRKALQAELDEVRVCRSHLRSLTNDWLAASGSSPGPSSAPTSNSGRRSGFPARARAEVSEGLGRQDAFLLASKALLLRLHARLERGLNSEAESALVRVWLQGARDTLSEFESGIRQQLALASQRDEAPLAEPGGTAPVATYEAFLHTPAPYDSGDFLDQPANLHRPRLVPELLDADPALAARYQELREQIAGYFGPPRGGLPYERHVERQHHPDPEDLAFCRAQGYFRYPIAPELGGGGKSKLEYYMLTTLCQRLADVSISLTIQVNSSLGSSPVLLVRNKELPRAEQEVAAFAGNAAAQMEITGLLDRLRAATGSEPASVVDKRYRELQTRLDATVLRSTPLRALFHRFSEAWQRAGAAGRAFDLAGFSRHLAEAGTAWKEACSRAGEYREELSRRREASDLFLRWVASGQISAFALTEPSAGSDTARVATRAVLRSVPVEREADGVLRFVPQGGKEPRYLLDAKKLVFETHGQPPVGLVAYRHADAAEPAPIHFDEYDYETDRADGLRYYDHGGRRVHFTDIAQLRERDGQLWYDYWELTGAKMWITNGRMCGVMCLYAKTDEGITGFMVDRHAEGLVVGKDEEKLGQCGSPTNELALQAVRVPRENVIGIEGRGQVNALETLNIGRAGLAMSAMAQLPGLIEQSRAFAQAAYGTIPDWVEWRLARMEEERFTAEALAFEVIGQFEHPQTKSVRLESAIAKALVSEALHRVIALAEDIHQLAGQTQLHLVEKRKRDARVLTIYEGTNEVQRFLLLKDLAGAKPHATPDANGQPSGQASREALELEALRRGVRQRVRAAVDLFGQELWQNPNLQANCFLLTEAVAWLKAADSTLGRFAWLDARNAEPGVPQQLRDTARQAWLRCGSEVRDRLRQFDEELGHLRRGFYADEVRAARLLFQRFAKPTATPAPVSRITKPLAVLVVLEPTAAVAPQPHIQDGRPAEAHWSLSAADGAALETAIRLRDQAVARVTIHAAAVGPRGCAAVLRDALSLGADRATLVLGEAATLPPDRAAGALADILRTAGSFDLVLGGQGKAGAEEGLLARYTATLLGVPWAGATGLIAVQNTETERLVELGGGTGPRRQRPLPAAVTIEPEIGLRPFTIEGYLAVLDRTVELQRWPRRREEDGVALKARTQTLAAPETGDAAGMVLEPAAAADRLLHVLGIHGPATETPPFAGPIEAVATPVLSDRVVAIIAAEASGRLDANAALTLRAATVLGNQARTETAVLVLVGAEEEAQRRAVAEVRTLFPGEMILLATDRAVAAAELRSGMIVESWPHEQPPPVAVVGEAWAEDALVRLALDRRELAGERSEPGAVALRLHDLAIAGEQLVVRTLRAGGKLLAERRVALAPGKTAWLTLAPDAEIAATPARTVAPTAPVQVWTPRLERFFGTEAMQRLLGDVQQELGGVRLADADFIIDVGFGVGNRDGYEAVIEPLEKALRAIGVVNVVIGGSRKVTEELHLLPVDRQIGQSGVSVNPRVLLAIGISGAPQHLSYIGPRAVILAFNRDPEAPLLTLNRRQPQPRVFPIIGDLFETVPAFCAALGQRQPAHAESPQLTTESAGIKANDGR